MAESAEIWLMLDPVGDQVFPVSTRAFEQITAPISRVLARNCVALFLDPAGTLRRIEALRPTRGGLGAHMRLWLGLPVPARFRFETLAAPLEDICTMVLDCAMYQRQKGAFEAGDWWLYTAPLDEIRAELGAATSLRDLYARLRFPTEQDCVDLL